MKIVRHMNFILESYLNILILCQVSQVVEDADLEVEELGASIRVTGPNSSGGAWDKSGDQQPAEPSQSDNNQFVAVEHTDHKDDADEESHVIPSGSPEKRPVEEAGLPPSVSFIDQVSGRGGSATCSLYIYQVRGVKWCSGTEWLLQAAQAAFYCCKHNNQSQMY